MDWVILIVFCLACGVAGAMFLMNLAEGMGENSSSSSSYSHSNASPRKRCPSCQASYNQFGDDAMPYEDGSGSIGCTCHLM